MQYVVLRQFAIRKHLFARIFAIANMLNAHEYANSELQKKPRAAAPFNPKLMTA